MTSLTAGTGPPPALSTPLTPRGATLPDRLVVAPPCRYPVGDGPVAVGREAQEGHGSPTRAARDLPGSHTGHPAQLPGWV